MDKREELYNLMKQYVSANNCIDISKFRKEHRNEYALLPHYFGGVNQAIEEFGWVKVPTTKHKKGNSVVTLRNRLAYDMLTILRKGGKIEPKTLEDIAQRYGVTRPGINQLYRALKTTIEGDQNESDLQ